MGIIEAIGQLKEQEVYKDPARRGELKWKKTMYYAARQAMESTGRLTGYPIGNIRRLLSPQYQRLYEQYSERGRKLKKMRERKREKTLRKKEWEAKR